MQKLQAKFKNTPKDASLVPCSVNSSLNKEETLSVKDKILTCNNPEENLHQHRGGSSLRVSNIVYVLNMRGQPLMPTTPRKARILLQSKKAKVVKRIPFTIQLTYQTGESKQLIDLCVDSGYKHIGLSAKTSKNEVFSADIKLRDNIKQLLAERSMYRRNKRNRLWYRKSRFNNRGKEGWFPPSIMNKINSHINIIDKICFLLPITNIIVETASFDIQKIKNPDIQGKEYQEGPQKDFDNVKAYVLYRDEYQCQYCKKSDIKLHVHHIESRQTGTNNPDNLITLCEKHHRDLHDGKIKLNVKKPKGFRNQTFMSIARNKMMEMLRKRYNNVQETFGYITKANRLSLGLEKSHINDAFSIGNGNIQTRCFSNIIVQKRRNNRCLQINRNGFKPSIRRKKSKLQPGDLVKVKNILYNVVGMFNKGTYVRVKNNMNKILNFNIKKINWEYSFGGFVWN